MQDGGLRKRRGGEGVERKRCGVHVSRCRVTYLVFRSDDDDEERWQEETHMYVCKGKTRRERKTSGGGFCRMHAKDERTGTQDRTVILERKNVYICFVSMGSLSKCHLLTVYMGLKERRWK